MPLTSAAIKEHARALGFDLCGIAAADAYPELEFLSDWLARGYAGEMHWMAETAERRRDVHAILPEARSVIVTGTLYEPAAQDSAPGIAQIAAYARGNDYHRVLKRRLDALIDWMRAQSPEPFDARRYVDDGPVQERVYAQYAGLGWIGKNTCLIHPEHGSLLFLGEIISTLPLEPDTQGLEQCGSCTRCLDACPTDALVEPGVLDATRCLSYLTIELRGSIPETLRPAIGAHAYGCDICQTVCPYNQPPTFAAGHGFRPRSELAEPQLVDLWRRTDDQLRELRRGTAMTRVSVAGLRRNIAVAIGNSDDAEAVAALAAPQVDSPSLDDPMVQEHVEWALAQHRERDEALVASDHSTARLRRSAKLP